MLLMLLDKLNLPDLLMLHRHLKLLLLAMRLDFMDMFVPSLLDQ